MKILGIESSCDDTAAAVVENGTNVLSSLVASQTSVHATWGGVIPNCSKRTSEDYFSVVDQAFKASDTLDDIDAIAVTQARVDWFFVSGCLLHKRFMLELKKTSHTC